MQYMPGVNTVTSIHYITLCLDESYLSRERMIDAQQGSLLLEFDWDSRANSHTKLKMCRDC